MWGAVFLSKYLKIKVGIALSFQIDAKLSYAILFHKEDWQID